MPSDTLKIGMVEDILEAYNENTAFLEQKAKAVNLQLFALGVEAILVTVALMMSRIPL